MPLQCSTDFCRLLRHDRIDEFNRRAAKEPPDLVDADLRGVDLRKADLSHADLRGAYLRQADLRGVDLSHAKLEGASIHGARIGGVLFPPDISAEEVRLSWELGTRMRRR